VGPVNLSWIFQTPSVNFPWNLAHFKNFIVKSRIFSRELGWSLLVGQGSVTSPGRPGIGSVVKERAQKCPQPFFARRLLRGRRRCEKSHCMTNISLYLGRNTRQGHSYNGRRILTRMLSTELCHFQWPWVTSNLDFKVMIFFNVR